MNKTRIEWCDYSINPVKGLCPMACSYCYARAMYKRFKWNPEIRYIGRTKLFDEMLKIPRDKNQRIFIGSTIELFGDWVEPYWMNDIFEVVNAFSFFTFIFLTKQPENLPKWSPFPENCWVGVTAADEHFAAVGLDNLKSVDAKVKFLSVEPLLHWVDANFWGRWFKDIDWLIIGQQTPVSSKTQPEIEWIREIVKAADKAGIPVFLKDNLRSALDLLSNIPLRQEFPMPSGR